MPGHKKITRRKPGDTSPRKYYFDENTQAAIVEFQHEQNIAIRNQIYTKTISPAFRTLVENLINVYKYQVIGESKEDLRNECVEFLFTVIGKFDITKGSKAFAYFNVVAMNWLSIKSRQSAKGVKTFVSIDNSESFSAHELEMIEHFNYLPACDEVITPEAFKDNIVVMLDTLKARSKTENEQNCVEAIKTLLDGIDDIDFINKRGVMVHMRDITNLTPKQLSVVLSSLKKLYKEYKKNGEFEI
jgi:hypothetical protein